MFTLIIGILAGMGIAFQSAVNARLRAHLTVPFLTSLVSFSIGFGFLVLLSWVSELPIQMSWKHIHAAPFSVWLGGLLGMLSLTINVLIFPKLGGVQTAVMPILGQVLMGVLIDHFAWLNAPEVPFSHSRIFGITLVLTGVFITVVLPNLSSLRSQTRNRHTRGWQLLGVIGGMALATQAAVNGELGRQLGEPFSAAIVSFFVGTLGLLCVVLYYEKSLKKLAKYPGQQPYWIWCGGILAGLFISASIWLVPQIGTGSVIMLMLLGLIIGSLLVDHFGWFGVFKKAVSSQQLFGVMLLLAGIACIRLM